MKIEDITFNENGLVPAIVQDEQTGNVLMLAYMNEEAMAKTIETKETWFYSRSREELWNKGATSGNRQKVKRLSYDCDQDTILVQVEPIGPACHTGEETCFFQTVFEEETPNRQIVHDVIASIRNRRNNPVEGSYTSYLFREGIDKVLKKVGEESSEVIIGAKNEDKRELTSELADLLYHSLVLMEISGVTITDVKKELVKRRIEK
ncbi:bifunctional phosphoribosyl-AMP cyclohydrolase/phosphoribosyl-ATP diphosphatase HisIE [Sporosarcina pasteurii]|uniref:Histidine biosynthesis bifunctional protein HisIE n=1 Tax=Sporosarcina pasteurii TaxID=1474 RepID=A0A380C713_SPOPA|nr:bifunctional phosphoribosyl-AMP cyclohydrolase/phosphoribosyl-ATP diphosphatase HisIE [Sporosarcina pasteurii]QBQ04546.1 bifunctional phosphoribosyl-AMP cyclohydrolase/phosphoribosyl-ATP diphosphatase HisIE [Sporosarcina pasteurii]SUJ14188.1 Phosphoribosyl-ATP pyrophosphatase [Sporosarcina pasteurii]